MADKKQQQALEELKHEIRNALLGIAANRAKIYAHIKRIVEITKNNDRHFKRIEEALKKYARELSGKN